MTSGSTLTDGTADAAGANEAPAQAAKADRDLAGVRRISLIAIGIALIVFVYFVIADRTTPFAADGRVQAFVVRVSPEVAGQVEAVEVIDNEVVEAGETLFRIDPTPFRIAVDQAQARLAQAGQNIGASTASVDVAQAALDEARATETNVRAQGARQIELVKRGVYAEAVADEANAAIDEARASVERAEADLARAREQLGPEGEDNPQVQEALAALERARFDLSKTTVTAPSRGVVTNLQLAGGQFVTPGQAAMTFISAEDVWLIAPMRENSVGVIAPGQRAEVVLDALPGRVFRATVESVGWGVASGSVDPATGLPKSTTQTGWLTQSERFPVQLVFDPDNMPVGARYGSRGAVMVYASQNPVMDGIGWLRMRLIALLTYIS